MSDTGEQGLTPHDPADNAGIGGGVVPDDQSEGYEQAVENAEHPAGDTGGSPSSESAGD